MGLFDSWKTKKKENQEQQAEETRKVLGEELLTKARSLFSDGSDEESIAIYREACQYSKNAIIELASIYKEKEQQDAYFNHCEKYGQKWAVTPDCVEISEALAECYQYGVGTKINKIEAYSILKRCAYARSMDDIDARIQIEVALAKCASEIFEDGITVLHDGRKVIKGAGLFYDPAYEYLQPLLKDWKESKILKWKETSMKHCETALSLRNQ